jgi:hypothetical protein
MSVSAVQEARDSVSPAVHGHTAGGKTSREYSSWNAMIQRCTNPNEIGYKNYGGRGISVCERWFDFANFFADMGARPDRMTLDRIDVNGNYEPSNCRWATYSDQLRNRRRSPVGSRAKDITGRKFGRLTVTGFSSVAIRPNGNKYSTWTCVCDCGSKIDAVGVSLRSGHTKSCGCFKRERTAANIGKYNAERKARNGYASRREHKRAQELKLLQQAGEISDLREQVPFTLLPKQIGERSCKYVADFVYKDLTSGVTVVEDCKGFRDPIFRIKRKMMLFFHAIRIRET